MTDASAAPLDATADQTVVTAAQTVVESAVTMADRYTLGVVLAIIIVLAFISLVAYVMWTNNRRELRLVGVIDGSMARMQEMLLMQDAHMTETRESLKEATADQREEHKEMILLLRNLRNQ